MYPQLKKEEHEYTWAEAERDLAINSFKFLKWSFDVQKEVTPENNIPPSKIPDEKK